MKALFITAAGCTEIRDISKPTIQPDEVLLRVNRVGFCGSDLNTFRGLNPMVTLPRIPGHEVAGTITETGSAVPARFSPGMKVTLSPYTSCGTCPSCRRNRPNACQFNQTLGVQRDGAMTEWVAVPWPKLYHSPKLDLKDLVLVEPLTVGFHAADRGRVGANEVVAVLGTGVIGLGAVAGAAARGATVVAVDIDDAKLALAKRMGAAHGIHSIRENLHERLQAICPGGPDVIIEAIGLPATFRAAVDEVSFTGRVVYIGYAKEPVTFETKYFVQKELDILGSRNALGDFADVIRLMESGKVPVSDIVTQTVPLDQAGDALKEWARNPPLVSKIVVALD